MERKSAEFLLVNNKTLEGHAQIRKIVCCLRVLQFRHATHLFRNQQQEVNGSSDGTIITSLIL